MTPEEAEYIDASLDTWLRMDRGVQGTQEERTQQTQAFFDALEREMKAREALLRQRGLLEPTKE